MANPNKIILTLVVNGQPVEVDGNVNAPIKVVAQQALQQSGNTGQPLENWELRDAEGNVLDMDRKLEEFGFPAGTKLFLSLKAGVGG